MHPGLQRLNQMCPDRGGQGEPPIWEHCHTEQSRLLALPLRPHGGKGALRGHPDQRRVRAVLRGAAPGPVADL